MMPISDPRDRFFYPHHTSMKDTYYLLDTQHICVGYAMLLGIIQCQGHLLIWITIGQVRTVLAVGVVQVCFDIFSRL